jgi:hypothetical protein
LRCLHRRKCSQAKTELKFWIGDNDAQRRNPWAITGFFFLAELSQVIGNRIHHRIRMAAVLGEESPPEIPST